MKKNMLVLLCLVVLVSGLAFASGNEEKGALETTDGPYVPTKDFTWVVPFSAGGNSDIPARIFAKYMSKYSDNKIKITNIVGAGGKAGAREVMNSTPDGSMLIMQPVGYPMQYALGVADFTYEDFAPIGQWLSSTLAVVVNALYLYLLLLR